MISMSKIVKIVVLLKLKMAGKNIINIKEKMMNMAINYASI